MLKYSRQREAIQCFLMTRKDHPTAETIYSHVKEEFPNISLGTVYRNLGVLEEIGTIQKITTRDGADRFDGNPAPHYHFFCTKCGCVMDLEFGPLKELDSLADNSFAGNIQGHTAQFYGICPACIKHKK